MSWVGVLQRPDLRLKTSGLMLVRINGRIAKELPCLFCYTKS